MIEAIPDRGYDKNPEQRRKALLEKVEAFERMMEKKDYAGALQKLSSDIRDKIEKWLVPFGDGAGTVERTRGATSAANAASSCKLRRRVIVA